MNIISIYKVDKVVLELLQLQAKIVNVSVKTNDM